MKKFPSVYSLVIISLLVAFASCSASKKADKAETPNIKYKKWALNSIGGIWVDSVTAKTAYVIFNNDGTMGGNTGCNSFGGNYLISENNALALSGVYVTEMHCTKNVFERPLLDAINKVNKFSVENTQLILWNGDERLIVFTQPAR